MKQRVNSLFLSILIILITSWGQTQAQQVSFFDGSLAELENQSKQSRTPYFLFFKVLDCEACTKMQNTTFKHLPLANYTTNSYLALEVDGLDFAQGIDIATRYNVRKYPTTMILGPDGQVRERIEGYIDGPMMLTILQKAVRPSDRDRVNRPLNTYSPPSSRGTTARMASNERDNAFDDRFGSERGYASDNSFDASPTYRSNPNMVSNNTADRGEAENYDFGVDKRDYLNDYFQNRSQDNLQPKSGTSRGGDGYANNYNSNQVSRDNLNNSYYDDRTRPLYNEAAKSGDYPYNKPAETPVATIQDRYGNDSYLDDRNRDGNYTSQSGTYRGGENMRSSQSEASFLDPIETRSTTQRTRGGDPVYGQEVRDLESLPDGTILKRGEDGKWYIYDESQSRYNDPEQMTRGEASSNMRTRGVAVQEERSNALLLANTPKSITRSVPGFAEFSPKNLSQNTFGLVVGTYLSISELQDAMQEFMENNNAKMWVYSEKLAGKHFFKLVMGEYQGEQQAVSDALRMGASWEDIEVVNLAKLR